MFQHNEPRLFINVENYRFITACKAHHKVTHTKLQKFIFITQGQ